MLIVQKFGGSSVSDINRIGAVAEIIAREIRQNHDVVVVVSAMQGVTDELISKAASISTFSTSAQRAEYDSIIASGEQISSGMLALALQNLGINARSWLGWQIGMHTNNCHANANIISVDIKKIKEEIAAKHTPIIAGFQGISSIGRITTLGRGGSDTSAVAIAAALKADRCDIYTDVEGIYTADPRIVENAYRINSLSYEEMLEMSASGSRVLQPKSVEIAQKHDLALRVLSSFVSGPGSLVLRKNLVDNPRPITAISHDENIVLFSLKNESGDKLFESKVFSLLGHINISTIVKNKDNHDSSNLSFTTAISDASNTAKIIDENREKLNYKHFLMQSNLAKVSLIGADICTSKGIANKMFDVLAEEDIEVNLAFSSDHKLSVLISKQYVIKAANKLHEAFKLNKIESTQEIFA